MNVLPSRNICCVYKRHGTEYILCLLCNCTCRVKQTHIAFIWWRPLIIIPQNGHQNMRDEMYSLHYTHTHTRKKQKKNKKQEICYYREGGRGTPVENGCATIADGQKCIQFVCFKYRMYIFNHLTTTMVFAQKEQRKHTHNEEAKINH